MLPGGSPPHTRGKVGPQIVILHIYRITPAYAGKSCTGGSACTRWWDHPRIRGEKSLVGQLLMSCQGSPPHTRGKAQLDQRPADDLGITPAYAGKSPTDAKGYSAEEGSPPHTRGKAAVNPLHKGRERITPAYAGKRNEFGSHLSGKRDHPRIRGEKQNQRKDVFLCPRITPAYAGKSCTDRLCAPAAQDHPRIRGEKKQTTPGGRSRCGSPPHTRGKVLLSRCAGRTLRITPAYAGKS